MKTNLNVFLLLLLALVFGCKAQQKAVSTGNEVTVVGTAEHAKMGAVVINKAGTYYIEGKQNWDKEGYYKKQVRVTGILTTKTNKSEDLVNDKGEIMQGAVGEISWIKMSKCELDK